MIKIKKEIKSRVFQGDIFKNVEYIEYAKEESGIIEVSKIIFPFVIVLTQDCDLEWDYKYRWSRTTYGNQDKWLLSTLVAPLYNAEHMFEGSQLSKLNMNMSPLGRNSSTLKNNKNPRYHYLEFSDEIPIVISIIDFKHYFSVNNLYLKKIIRSNFVCRVSELYREDISQRFASFLSRIGLPNY
mgnify:CR=1 FL=1